MRPVCRLSSRPAFRLSSLIVLLFLVSSAATAQRPELVVQAGHREYPRSVAFAPDGKTFVTASRDRLVKLWETETGRLVRGLEANAYLSREAISFAPDGATLAVVTYDATVDLWEATCNSGQALEAAERRRGPMNSKGLAQLAYEKGMYILTASQSYEAAQEVSQLGHGLLTYALVEEGLKRAAADAGPKDGTVFAKEWLDYAARRVPEIQLDEMARAAAAGRELSFADDDRGLALARRQGQRPRLYYRRELEARPLVVAKTGN